MVKVFNPDEMVLGQISDWDITILLSTFNGARFLPEQLASFAGQTHRGWRLLWRDDGSGDHTLALLDRFTHLYPPGQVVQSSGSGVHLGIFNNNMALIGDARDAPAVALAESLDCPLVTHDARLFRSPGHRARIELV